MTTPQPFSCFTAIAYVNGAPHLGHALEFLEGDAIARFHRLSGKDVYFQVGTDEHGQKIKEKAEEHGITPQELADQNAKLFEDTKESLDISYDAFVRTTSPEHKAVAQEIWELLVENGDIEKRMYEGKYCVGCEKYMLDTDLDEEGKCPIHKKTPEIVQEENHFFKLSKYGDRILQKLESRELEILPHSRANEIINVIKGGLHDVSFSRPKSSLDWGIPVPGDDDYVMYVWCDALTNYLTGPGFTENTENFQKYWPANLHIIGKDILRFHAAIWPGMLIAANEALEKRGDARRLELPKQILVHGFITSQGHKMSKSLGNVVSHNEIIAHYGLDAFRAYFLGMTPLGDDIDFTWEKFHELYEKELVNNFGNLTNRILVMAGKYCEGKTTAVDSYTFPESTALLSHVLEKKKEFIQRMNGCDHKKAFEALLSIFDHANQYINALEPWKRAKDTPEDNVEIMNVLLLVLYNSIPLLDPLLPDAACRLAGAFDQKIPEHSLTMEALLHLAPDTKIDTIGHLFDRKELPTFEE